MQSLRRILIFSKDRAIQLVALLESLENQCLDFEESIVTILYRTTSTQYQDQYIQIQKMFPSISFRREKEVSTDFLNIVMNSQYIMFLADDSIFIREFRFSDTIASLDENLDCIGFSLRLGKNITYSYPHAATYEETPNFIELNNGLLKFDWRQQTYDFGYPMELSSSVYRSSDILDLSAGMKYTSLHNVESTLDIKKAQMAEEKPMLLCFPISHACNIPINLTSDLSMNRVGGNAAYSVELLANKFDEGYKMDISSFEDFTPIGCHQEVPLSWIER